MGGKIKLKSLIGFRSSNKIDNCNVQGAEGREGRKKKKKIQKNLENKSKHKNNKRFS